MGDRISITISEDLRFVPKEFLKEWIDGGFIESKQCLKIWDQVQHLVQDQSQVGLYLAGPMGVGKSAIMYYVVHRARQLGWFVVYIPRCDDWLSQSLGSPADWYAYFFDAVLAGLQSTTAAIQQKYKYCIPSGNRVSWIDALIDYNLSHEYFMRLFDMFCEDIVVEQAVEVILAFDEVQALFVDGVQLIRAQQPFSIIDWGMNYKRGCIFVTVSADLPYCLQLGSGHEQFVSHICGLTDDEVKSWFQTPQFAQIAQNLDFAEELIPEIRSITGNIPRELLILGKDFGDLNSSLRYIIEQYSVSRRSLYLQRFYEFEVNHPEIVQRVLNSLVNLIAQVHINSDEFDLRFLDTGLVYIDGGRVKPLNSNATNLLLKIINLEGKMK
ncbi:hypothetical protein MP228_004131 [Amoeboaphelidium protococcarum]|nr:hypothetical protein MP228_004131 [Amoeboaphelidium protococcarum]